MGEDDQQGLLSRKTADRVAIAIFGTFLVFFLVLLVSGHPGHVPATATTRTSSVQTVQGPHGVIQTINKTQQVTTDVVPSVWQSLLGGRQTIFLICAAALFGAYLLAAITQRVLLGRYALSLGPLSVPEMITANRLEVAFRSALSGAPLQAGPQLGTEPQPELEPQPEAEEPQAEPQPVGAPAWADVSDPNLALAGWRIDLEKELRRIATEYGVADRDQRSLRMMLDSLTRAGVIPYPVAVSLRDLLPLANQGVHGASVDEGVIHVLRTDGAELLRYLRTIGATKPMP